MDNFIDKLAQKWNAGEVIKANSAAEAFEAKRMREQIAKYEEILEEMRKLNLKNEELADVSRELVEEGIREIRGYLKAEAGEESLEKELLSIKEQILAIHELLREKDENKVLLEEIINKSEEFIHKENVKVYRNVQAVVTEGLASQKEELHRQNGELLLYVKGIKPILFAVLVLLVLNMAGVAAFVFGLVR